MVAWLTNIYSISTITNTMVGPEVTGSGSGCKGKKIGVFINFVLFLLDAKTLKRSRKMIKYLPGLKVY